MKFIVLLALSAGIWLLLLSIVWPRLLPFGIALIVAALLLLALLNLLQEHRAGGRRRGH